MLKKINSKEVKNIQNKIYSQWGDYLPNGDFLINKKNKIWLINKLPKLYNVKVDRIGIYVGEIEKDGIRLSIEGAQMLNPKKNYLNLNETQLKKWLKGENLTIKTNLRGYVILKYNNHIIGCGKVKNNILLNYVPKNRRIQNLV